MAYYNRFRRYTYRPRRGYVSYARSRPYYRKRKSYNTGYAKHKRTCTFIKRFPATLYPDKKVVRHRYADSVKITVTAGLAGDEHVFRGNSLYDPDYTQSVGGHQPMGFDEMALVYNRYRVKVSKIDVRVNLHTTSTLNWKVILYKDPIFASLSTFADFLKILENGKNYTMKKLMDSDKSVHLQMTGAVSEFYDDSTDEQFASIPSSNPASWFAYRVMIFNEDGQNVTEDCVFTVDVMMDFVAEWTKPKLMEQS